MVLLGMTKKQQLYDYVRRHRVPHRGLGRRLLFDEDDLLRPRAARPVDVATLARDRAARDLDIEQGQPWRH